MADPNDPNRPAYPPQQSGYPPQQGGGYPPQQGGYPPQQGGYPPQAGYGPQPGYPPQQGGYPPPGYPPHPQPARSGLPAYRIILGIVGIIGIGVGVYGLATSGVFGGGSSSSTTSYSAPAPAMPMATPVTTTPATPMVTTQALAGRWSTSSTNFDCSKGGGLIFTADGRWGTPGRIDSRFSARGDFYSTTGPGGRELTYRVTSFDGNRLVTQGVNNPWGSVLQRCP